MSRPILVTGGTGTVGRVVVDRLVAAGREVRVLSRRPRPSGVQPMAWATGDLRSGAGVGAAVAGVETIVHCATTYGRRDVEAVRNLVDAAARGGRPHLVYISIVGVDRIPLWYYQAKHQAERIIENSGLPWTILRTTQFHDLLVRMSSVQRPLPVVVTLSGVAFQPIAASEVGDRLAELAAGAPAGRVPDIGGPEIHHGRDLALAYLRAAGRRRFVLPVRVPGRVFDAYRRGEHLAPDRAVGRTTFAEFLAERRATGEL